MTAENAYSVHRSGRFYFVAKGYKRNEGIAPEMRRVSPMFRSGRDVRAEYDKLVANEHRA